MKNVAVNNEAHSAMAHAYAVSAMLYNVLVNNVLFARKSINSLELVRI